MSLFIKLLTITAVFMGLTVVILYLSTGWPGPREAIAYGDDPHEAASLKEWSHFLIVFLVPALMTGVMERRSKFSWSIRRTVLFYLGNLAGFIALIIAAHIVL